MTRSPVKRVAVVAPAPVAGTVGGAERAWLGLVDAISRLTPHTAELVTVPVEEHNLVDLVKAYRRFAELDVSRFDVVITSKYPAWMIDHPCHVVHMFHPLRGLYDTYPLLGMAPQAELAGGEQGPLRQLVNVARGGRQRRRLGDLWAAFDALVAERGADDPVLRLLGPLAREIVHHLDAVALHPSSVRRFFALSATVAGRAGYFPPTVTPGVVHLPSSLPALAPHSAAPSAGFFTASRLDGPKRIDLMVGAMAHVPNDVSLTIAGEGPEGDRLERLAAGDGRIHFVGRVDDHTLALAYQAALAVPFVPADEDYGLITLEAMACATPVITTSDAGGPTELVVNGVNGLVSEPTPQALGRAMSHLTVDRAWARHLGQAGRRRSEEITWEAAVAALLDEPDVPLTVAPGPASGQERRPKIVATSTYGIFPARGGGQLRYVHLYGALARHADVEVLSLVSPPRPERSQPIAPGLTETLVGVSDEQWQDDADLTRAVGFPVTDVVAGRSIAATPRYIEVMRRALEGADAVLLSHPFLLPAVEAAGWEGPVVYDAHNAEADLKGLLLSGTAPGRQLAGWVAEVEGRAVRRSAHVLTCSTEDAAALARRYGLTDDGFVVVANGTDNERFVPTLDERRRRSQAWRVAWSAAIGPRLDKRYERLEPDALAVYFASWHLPNLDAAEAIIDLAPALPEVVFVLAGSHSDHFRNRPMPPNLVLAGVVSDTAKDILLSSADVALNPMRQGSGTNLKLVEYFAAGVPAVSTPFGARGVDVDQRHLALAELDGFAAAVRNVLADPVAATTRAETARHLARERYDWRVLGDRVAEVISASI